MHCVMQITDDSPHILLSLNEAKEGTKIDRCSCSTTERTIIHLMYSAFQKIQRHFKEQLKNKIRTYKTISKSKMLAT